MAAQRLDGMVSIVWIKSIVLQSIHLDGAVLVPLRALYCFLLFLPLPPFTMYYSAA